MTEKLRNIIPVGTLIISIVLAYFLDSLFPIFEIIPPPFNRSGWIFVVLGFGMVIFSAFTLLSKRTTLYPAGSPSFLVTEGPFAFSRNPIYLGDLMIAAGAAIILSSLSSFFVPILFFVVLNNFVIPLEEKRLAQIFGEAYDKYKNRVHRWL